jgi:hypothetical protein
MVWYVLSMAALSRKNTTDETCHSNNQHHEDMSTVVKIIGLIQISDMHTLVGLRY